VDGLPVYGVAIPSVRGLRSVLDKLDCQRKPLLWHNMREEPVRFQPNHLLRVPHEGLSVGRG
jgi:hypothetical protein